ncbi:MAG: DUF2202 domain-containing protein [Christensenella sp.]|nr:DUF2202 domain-containing protein [Christensenella sp.]
MKQKLTIAIAAILTSSLLLAGCSAWTAPAETTADETLSYGAYSAREDEALTGTGYRGRSETAGSNYAADSYVANDTVEDSYYGYGANGNNGNGNGLGLGYTDDCDPIYDGTTTADPNYTLTDADKTASLTGYGSAGALADESLSLADMLTYAVQDEYLARAEYDQILSDFGRVRPFTNIIRAEETHIDALLPLFTAYGITAPADEGASRAVSTTNLTESYQAGVNAEVNNIAMYETFLDQNLPDNVRIVFESLMHASENHLRAFQNQL